MMADWKVDSAADQRAAQKACWKAGHWDNLMAASWELCSAASTEKRKAALRVITWADMMVGEKVASTVD